MVLTLLFAQYQNMTSNKSMPYFNLPLERERGSKLKPIVQEASNTSLKGYARLSRYANHRSRYRWVIGPEIIARGNVGRSSGDSCKDEEQRDHYQESQYHSATELCNGCSS